MSPYIGSDRTRLGHLCQAQKLEQANNPTGKGTPCPECLTQAGISNEKGNDLHWSWLQQSSSTRQMLMSSLRHFKLLSRLQDQRAQPPAEMWTLRKYFVSLRSIALVWTLCFRRNANCCAKRELKRSCRSERLRSHRWKERTKGLSDRENRRIFMFFTLWIIKPRFPPISSDLSGPCARLTCRFPDSSALNGKIKLFSAALSCVSHGFEATQSCCKRFMFRARVSVLFTFRTIAGQTHNKTSTEWKWMKKKESSWLISKIVLIDRTHGLVWLMNWYRDDLERRRETVIWSSPANSSAQAWLMRRRAKDNRRDNCSSILEHQICAPLWVHFDISTAQFSHNLTAWHPIQLSNRAKDTN